jgi:hypothetical protein
MAAADSPIDSRRLSQARALLAEPRRGESLAAVAAAAVFFTVSALALAFTVITLPPHWGA